MKRNYWKTVNEGGEGYTPYAERYPESTLPRIWDLIERKNRIQSNICYTSTADTRYDELKAELAAVKAEIEVERAKGGGN